MTHLISNFIKRELTGWKTWQVLWLLLSNIIILCISLSMGDSIVGIVASMTGICCVVLVGMGKISNYFFGIINVTLYAYVAWKAKYYGDVMLNLLYYLPTNIMGWIFWSRHIDVETAEVSKRRLNGKQCIAIGLISIAGISVVSGILRLIGGNLPWADSSSTVLSMIAQYLMIKRYTEQWIAWIAVNIVSIVMWIAVLGSHGASIAVLLMWTVFLINSIIMYIRWRKILKDK